MPDILKPEQRHREAAEEAASAANIVSHDGYYEVDIGKVAEAFARFEADHLPQLQAMREALESLCDGAIDASGTALILSDSSDEAKAIISRARAALALPVPDGWMLPQTAGVCAYDRDECTVTVALDNIDQVMAMVKALPCKGRVMLVDEPTPPASLTEMEDRGHG